MISFAAENYSEKQIEAFNKALDSNDPDLAALAVEGLKSRFEATTGRQRKANAPRNFKGGAKPSGSQTVKPFSSDDEMVAAMSDPKYETSAAYRKMVEKRLAATV